MNLAEIQILVDYNYWARNRMLDAVGQLTAEQYERDMGSSFKSIRDTVTHGYAAEWIWYSRWQGESPTSLISPDRFPNLGALTAAWGDLETKIRTLVAAAGDAGLQKTLHYKLVNGTASAAPLWHMVQHVVNHATYHRGQVTTMLRQLGAAPPKSEDLIAFYRERG